MKPISRLKLPCRGLVPPIPAASKRELSWFVKPGEPLANPPPP